MNRTNFLFLPFPKQLLLPVKDPESRKAKANYPHLIELDIFIGKIDFES
jgi:hypothetical protein